VILGEDEVRQGTVNLKRSGEKDQISVKREELVSRLRDMEGSER